MRLNSDEMINTIGGAANWSGTFINSITKALTFIFELGKTIGSAIRYKRSNMYC